MILVTVTQAFSPFVVHLYGVTSVLALTTDDIVDGVVTLRRATTKGKSGTRTLPMHPKLIEYLEEYNPPPGLLFPGRGGEKPLTRAMVDLILKAACKRVRLGEPVLIPLGEQL